MNTLHRYLVAAAAMVIAAAIGVRTAFAVEYVTEGGAGAGDGTSWADAWASIQDAIDSAGADEEIWVAQGTYQEPDPSVSMLVMKASVALYGGFAGTETSRNQRDWSNNRTTITAEGHTFVRCILFNNAPNARVDGFTIADANCLRSGTANPDIDGAAILIDADSDNAIIANCILADNLGQKGGAIYLTGAGIVISNCVFVGNQAQSGGGTYGSESGGAIYAWWSTDLTVTDCIFGRNLAHLRGGIYLFQDENTTIRNCRLAGNQATYPGGIALDRSIDTRVENCVLAGNVGTSAFGGGAIRVGHGTKSASGTVINCTIADNYSQKGGGLAVVCGTAVTRNCIVGGNNAHGVSELEISAGYLGVVSELGYCLFDGSRTNVPGDVLVDNVTTLAGAAQINAQMPQASNNVGGDAAFVGGPAGTWTAAPVYDPVARTTTLTDSAAAFRPGAFAGAFINPKTDQWLTAVVAGNTTNAITVWGNYADLGTVGAAYRVRDYRLRAGSAAINAASPTGAPATDIDGNPRRGAPDIGAYQYIARGTLITIH